MDEVPERGVSCGLLRVSLPDRRPELARNGFGRLARAPEVAFSPSSDVLRLGVVLVS